MLRTNSSLSKPIQSHPSRMNAPGRVGLMTKPLTFMLVVFAAATAIAVVLPGQMRNVVTLSWDYDTNNLPDAFKLYSSTNLSEPATNWTPIATLSGTIRNVTISNIPKQECWFYVTASNWWGESLPSNIAWVPQPPSEVSNLRISRQQ